MAKREEAKSIKSIYDKAKNLKTPEEKTALMGRLSSGERDALRDYIGRNSWYETNDPAARTKGKSQRVNNTGLTADEMAIPPSFSSPKGKPLKITSIEEKDNSEDAFINETLQAFTGKPKPKGLPEVVYDDAFAEEELAKVGAPPKKQTGVDRLDALFPTTTPTPTPAPAPVPADIDPEDAAADEIEQWAPKDLYLDPVYHDLNTAEPATEEEIGLFDSKAFKDSALVFGLSLLMGNDIQESLGYAGSAYVREDYKNTEEYEDFTKMGVPESVILSALETDDWSEARAWYNQGQKAQQELKELMLKAGDTSLDEAQRGAYGRIATEAQELSAQMQLLSRGIDRFVEWKPEDVTGPQSLQIMYDFVKAMDPESAVREGELALVERMLGTMGVAANDIKRFFSTQDVSVLPAGAILSLRNHMHEMSKIKHRDIANRLDQLYAQGKQVGASDNLLFWGGDTQRFKDAGKRKYGIVY